MSEHIGRLTTHTVVIPLGTLLRLKQQLATEIITPPERLIPFMESYQAIRQDDQQGPIYCKTTRFNNQLFRLKDGTNTVDYVQRNQQLFRPKTERARIETELRTFMNKITQENFTSICSQIIGVVSSYDNADALDIVASAIMEKALYDEQFQSEYLKLIHRLNGLTDWFKNLVNTVCDETKGHYFWNLRSSIPTPTSSTSATAGGAAAAGSSTSTPAVSTIIPIMNGPFTSEEDMNRDILHKVTFKAAWTRKLQNLFNGRREFSSLRVSEDTEQKQYYYRRRVFGTVQLVVHTYKMSLISERILWAVIESLLHLKDPLESAVTKITNDDVESVDIILKFFKHDNQKPYPDERMNTIMTRLASYRTLESLTRRHQFMISDLIAVDWPIYTLYVSPPLSQSTPPVRIASISAPAVASVGTGAAAGGAAAAAAVGTPTATQVRPQPVRRGQQSASERKQIDPSQPTSEHAPVDQWNTVKGSRGGRKPSAPASTSSTNAPTSSSNRFSSSLPFSRGSGFTSSQSSTRNEDDAPMPVRNTSSQQRYRNAAPPVPPVPATSARYRIDEHESRIIDPSPVSSSTYKPTAHTGLSALSSSVHDGMQSTTEYTDQTASQDEFSIDDAERLYNQWLDNGNITKIFTALHNTATSSDSREYMAILLYVIMLKYHKLPQEFWDQLVHIAHSSDVIRATMVEAVNDIHVNFDDLIIDIPHLETILNDLHLRIGF